MKQNSIVPAQEISGYKLDWTFDELKKHLKSNYTVEKHKYCWVVYYENFSFWLNTQIGKITQIGVTGNFNGTFNGTGIGSTLLDVKQKFGNWKEGLDVYQIPQYEGICFELADNDEDEEWIQEIAPIESIYVFNPETTNTNIDIVFDTVNQQYIDKRAIITE